MKTIISCFLFLTVSCMNISGQDTYTDTLANKLMYYIHTINNFSRYIPHEKVHLHFDNTSYYQGDNIWFKCYIVNSQLRQGAELSKTLYVELLNPGGEIIDKRILKIENGQCHGEFTLNRIPFYSGFYEIRAYTKYMLNFGNDIIFSRVFPIFDKPKQEGNFEEKGIMKYSHIKYPMIRKKPKKDKKVNLALFPEGGNLVQGIASQVAFEATDEYGNPIEVTGSVINNANEQIAQFSVIHEGKGIFTYTPVGSKQKAIVEYNNKKYKFDMPAALPQGFVAKVDNLSSPDSIEIALQKNSDTPDNMIGMTVISGGKLHNVCLVDVSDNETVRFKTDKTGLPSGVSRIVLFNSKGKIVYDRLIFTDKNERLAFKVKTDKEEYNPYELVNMEFALTDKQEIPIQSTFSVSVKDATNGIKYDTNILTDLLLMSEIKGYVRNPSYYFEANDQTHRTALDLLLMVQGWRRYSWEQMAGTEPFELKYQPEKGIEVHGKTVSFVRKMPKPNVQVSFYATKIEGENTDRETFLDTFITDSLGQFAFRSEVEGKWNMILSVTEKGKKKDHRIILDRLFSPDPERYKVTDMRIDIFDNKQETIDNEDLPEETDPHSMLTTWEDSLTKIGINQKVHQLKEVTINAKKRSREKDIYESRSKSIAYYDVQSELDDITDKGEYIGSDIHGLLLNMNETFMPRPPGDYLSYKGRLPLFVIDYERTKHSEFDYNKYKMIRIETIKSIYISEDFSTMAKYADPYIPSLYLDKIYGCTVLIETHPEGKIPAEAGKGVRKTWLEGYSSVKEFYSPDYSMLEPEPDYRRTLYWNPSVTPDKDGKAVIRFYNNSRCKKFTVDAETISPRGEIGVYRNI